MTPALPSNDARNQRICHSVVNGEGFLCDISCLICFSYGYDVSLRQFYRVRSRPDTKPSLVASVFNVVFIGAIKQMIWTNTRRIVATMTSVVFRPSEIGQIKRQARGSISTPSVIWLEVSIPVFIASCLPFPALTLWPLAGRPVYVDPKTLNFFGRQRGWCKIRLSHELILLKQRISLWSGSRGVYRASWAAL